MRDFRIGWPLLGSVDDLAWAGPGDALFLNVIELPHGRLQYAVACANRRIAERDALDHRAVGRRVPYRIRIIPKAWIQETLPA